MVLKFLPKGAMVAALLTFPGCETVMGGRFYAHPYADPFTCGSSMISEWGSETCDMLGRHVRFVEVKPGRAVQSPDSADSRPYDDLIDRLTHPFRH